MKPTLNETGEVVYARQSMKIFGLWFGLLLVFPAAALAGEGEKLLIRFLDDTRSLSARFQQTLRSDDGFVMQQSSGRFYLQRPGKFRWDYTQPYAQQIISDGDKVYVYDVDLQQVTVQSQQNAAQNTPMALMQNRRKLTEVFDVQELDQRDGVYRLKLTSRKPQAEFGSIIVGVDRNGLRFLQLKDPFDQLTDIVFDDIQTNPALRAELFEFQPPAGVDVFDGG